MRTPLFTALQPCIYCSHKPRRRIFEHPQKKRCRKSARNRILWGVISKFRGAVSFEKTRHFETTPHICCPPVPVAADSQGITKGICKVPCGILCGVCGIVRVLKRPPQIRCRAAVYAADSRGITKGICKPRCGILGSSSEGSFFFFSIFCDFFRSTNNSVTTSPY